jgi:hypothetical protein
LLALKMPEQLAELVDEAAARCLALREPLSDLQRAILVIVAIRLP